MTMVVGVVLPPGHAIFRCSLTSSVILLPSSGRQVCYQNKDDNQLVQVLHEDFVHEVPKVAWGIGGGLD